MGRDKFAKIKKRRTWMPSKCPVGGFFVCQALMTS